MAFGGGSEMLREGDLTGHWALIESGMKYHRPFLFLYQRVSERFRRIFTLVGHLPWLARFIMLIPGSTNDLDTMRKACFEKVMARKKKGAKQKDLFYYLVSTKLSPSLVGVQTRSRCLRSPMNSVQKKKKYHLRLSSTTVTSLLLLDPIPRRRPSPLSSFTSSITRRSSTN